MCVLGLVLDRCAKCRVPRAVGRDGSGVGDGGEPGNVGHGEGEVDEMRL